MSDSCTKKNLISFLPALAAFALVCFIRHFKFTMSTYNTTLLALSYEYGFLPRGLIGTLFHWVTETFDHIEWNYMGAFNFSGAFTLLYFILLFVFYKVCLNHCTEESKRNLKHLLVFLSIFAFPMYTTSVNFGCLDLYLGIILLLCLILLVWNKAEWLIVPLGIIGMCINHDFIFTHAMLIGVLLIYKLLNQQGNKRIKYALILLFFLIASLSLFSHFENYTYESSTEIANEIKVSAKALSESGNSYGKTYLDEEILGNDLSLSASRLDQNEDNLQDLPVFLVLFSPYLVAMFYLFLRLSGDSDTTKAKRISYLIVLLGSVCILPMLFNDVYYGRYMFQLVFYYIACFITFISLGDNRVSNCFDLMKTDMKKLTPMTFVWFLYPFLLTPFRAVAISSSIHDLAEVIFTELTYFIQP
ncbi:MAG: hypothetical protein IJE49_03710 [Agathobacter sp.]|nr:hypothetical protein [Agathobacter sp.]